jgi:drug/metabolite transporter (DMT)-like permease
MSRSLQAHLWLVAATLVWGSTFLAIKLALDDASPLLFNAVRMTIAAIVLVAMFFRRQRTLTAGAMRAGFAIGTLLWLGYEFQSAGLVYTTASKSAFVTGISVVLVPLLLAAAGRRVHPFTLAGVAAASFGLYLLCIPASREFSLAGINRGDVLTLGCALSFAVEIIVLGRAAQRYSFAELVPVQIAVCAGWMLLSVAVAERHAFLHPTPALMAALAYTALPGTVACFIIQAWAQRYTPPTHAALIFALEPVFAALLSYVAIGERLGLRGVLGAALILAGVLASELLGHVQKPEQELEQECGEQPAALERDEG